MQETLSNKSGKNKIENKIEATIDLISELILEITGEKYDLDSIERAGISVLNMLRKKSTEQLINAKEPTEAYCPECGVKMKMKDRKSKTVKGFSEYKFLRRNFYCMNCSLYIRPLDDIINCQDGYTREIQEAIVLLGQRIPFAEAQDYLEKLLKVKVSHEKIQEKTEAVGNRIYKEEKKRLSKMIDKQGYIKPKYYKTDKRERKKGTAYLMPDGSMVQTREEKWKETRNGILFADKDRAQVDKYHNMILKKKYFSVFNRNKNSLEEFKRRTTQEAFDFGFHLYEQQVIIGDGAVWIWDYADIYHPEAIKILDYYHACEYLGNAVESLTTIDDQMKKEIFDKLEEGSIKQIIAWLYTQKQTDAVKTCSRYFDNNKDRMEYGKYRRMGLDIGSGSIESAHRSIIQVRMKHSGMHWGKANVQSMVSLRAKYLSGEWSNIAESYIRKAA